MQTTTIKISCALRDRLAEIAIEDYEGSTLAQALERLLAEHEERRVLAAYERLQEDEEAWASYRRESAMVDGVAGDWARGDDRT